MNIKTKITLRRSNTQIHQNAYKSPTMTTRQKAAG